MSFDEPADNLEWANDEGFLYELWTDEDRVLALTYGAASSASQSFAGRITVVLDAEGELVLEYLEDIVVGTHPALVYDDCAQLF